MDGAGGTRADLGRVGSFSITQVAQVPVAKDRERECSIKEVHRIFLFSSSFVLLFGVIYHCDGGARA